MTTVIKIGDKVTWQDEVSEDARITPLAILGCKVLALYDRDGKAAAMIDTPIGKAHAWVKDLKPEHKPDKTTILSGG